jgi:hypothetical protein
MLNHRIPLFGALVVALAGCARAPVKIEPQTVAERAGWHARLATPSDLVGAVQVGGTASMGPGLRSGTTDVSVQLDNTIPGGIHPWSMHKGSCGMDQGMFGSPDAYTPGTVGSDGKASGMATVPVEAPTSGEYFVMVAASPGNMSTTIACGNLAPPVQ